jgi:hypothetical protein
MKATAEEGSPVNSPLISPNEKAQISETSRSNGMGLKLLMNIEHRILNKER